MDAKDLTLRTATMCDAQARDAETMPEMIPIYGVKGNSPLNQLSHYHVIWALTSDVAHDIYAYTKGWLLVYYAASSQLW